MLRRYVIGRIGQAIIVVIFVTIIVFALLRLLPGEPARTLLGPRASPAEVTKFKEDNGYDDPVPVQYGLWVKRAVTGDLGYSHTRNQSVRQLLDQYLPKTFLLVGLATAIAFFLAVALGVLQAARRNRFTDHAVTFLSFIFYSMPDFWLGQILIALFAVKFALVPAEAPQGNLASVLEDPAGLVLPVATLALVTIALFGRYMRASTIDSLSQDYVRTARAMGASNRRVLLGHVVRNSLIPVVTLVGLSLPWLVSGAIVVEAVFNYPGVGYLFWNSAQTKDFPVLVGISLVVGVLTVFGSLLADLLYGVLDPRVRYGGE